MTLIKKKKKKATPVVSKASMWYTSHSDSTLGTNVAQLWDRFTQWARPEARDDEQHVETSITHWHFDFVPSPLSGPL